MATPYKLQCKYKIIDCFITPDRTEVTVWLKTDKRSVKRYCEDTGLPYKEGLRNLYDTKQRIQQRTVDVV